MYLGEIARLVMMKCVDAKLLFEGKASAELRKSGRFYTKYISEIEGCVVVTSCMSDMQSLCDDDDDDSKSYVRPLLHPYAALSRGPHCVAPPSVCPSFRPVAPIFSKKP